ncbi:MAG: hypothetical protein Q4G35_09775 [Propionibacteriaceae bacterium]|nr:hypothetical protein [Propionibacteriaceae bacterium]
MALTEYHLTDPADMHPALALARYGKARKADLFLGFWLALIVEAQQMMPNPRTARRHVEKFFAGRDVLTALTETGAESVDAELSDAARVYFVSGLADPGYGSTMMRMRRLTAAQVREKAALEVVRAASLIVEAGLDQRLVGLLVSGYLAALAPHGAHELREAAQRYPQAQTLLESALEEHL